MFEESYRTPLIIKWPGVIKPGTTNNDMVSNIDLPETFLKLQVCLSLRYAGEKHAALLKAKHPQDGERSTIITIMISGSHMVKRHYGISNERYKLIHTTIY